MATNDLDDPGAAIRGLICGDVITLPASDWELPQDEMAVVIAKSPDTNEVAITERGRLIDYSLGDMVIPTSSVKKAVCITRFAEEAYWELMGKRVWVPKNGQYVVLDTVALDGVRVISEQITPDNLSPQSFPPGVIITYSHTEGYKGLNPQRMNLYHFYKVTQDGLWTNSVLMVPPGNHFEKLLHPI